MRFKNKSNNEIIAADELKQEEHGGGGIIDAVKEKVSEAADAIKHVFTGAEESESAKEQASEARSDGLGSTEEVLMKTGAAGLAEAERLEDFASSSELTEESGEKEKEA